MEDEAYDTLVPEITLPEIEHHVVSDHLEKPQVCGLIEAELNFDQLAIGFNVTYLLDALTAIESERVLLELKDANSSCLISAEPSGNDRHVVMPLKL